ncbi:MAG: hypothetical protein K2X47_16915 [Bdellovibrionales bacterium]|nr:hypothetical protein [Bdellovibrionales bacterium]
MALCALPPAASANGDAPLAACATIASNEAGKFSVPGAFLESFPLDARRAELAKQLPQETILKGTDSLSFENERDQNLSGPWSIPNRYIYHGTSFSAAEQILKTRQVVVTSTPEIHVSNINGRGWYFANYGVAASHAQKRKSEQPGVIIPAIIKQNAIIIEWWHSAQLPFYKNLLLKNNEDDDAPRRTFVAIAHLGVDVVLHHGEFIVLNEQALDYPTDARDLHVVTSEESDSFLVQTKPTRN